jgi:hypothetical protein
MMLCYFNGIMTITIDLHRRIRPPPPPLEITAIIEKDILKGREKWRWR